MADKELDNNNNSDKIARMSKMVQNMDQIEAFFLRHVIAHQQIFTKGAVL